jgi:two-component system, NarL family, response regulator DegU
MIKVLIADPYCQTRSGPSSIISSHNRMKVVCQTNDINQTIDGIKSFLPDIAVINSQLPPEGAIRVLKEFQKIKTKTKFLVLTNDCSDPIIIELLLHGASGCILRESSENKLIEAIMDILANKTPISPDVASGVLAFLRNQKNSDPSNPQGINSLSMRENMVLRYLGEGLSNKIIGSQLNISERTVEAHIRRILIKLNATSRTHAVIIAIRNGWIS